MAVAYTDRVVGLPRELEPWRALRGRGNNIWLRLGSANLPGTGRMRVFGTLQPNIGAVFS